MSASVNLEVPSTVEFNIQTLPQAFFPDLLRQAQNTDGGWGDGPGLKSSAEPTAWSILALLSHEEPSGRILSAATEWLLSKQSAEGAWPTSSAKDPGCWVTALASLALLQVSSTSSDAAIRGAKWLCDTWPAEGNLVWRLQQRWLSKGETIIRQDHSLRGWGWTPGTASWVEPTAYALILLQNLPTDLRPPNAHERLQLGEKMLDDRACPGGGWNAGNPLVYGVPGVPRVGPTAWALLALRHRKDHAVNSEGLRWLEQNLKGIRSPGSLALAQLCLSVYGRQPAPIQTNLLAFYKNNQFLQKIPVIAWVILALSDVPGWLSGNAETRGAL